MSRTSRRTRWLLVALSSVALLALASIGLTPLHTATATAAAAGDQVCHKVEDPSGTIHINRDGLIMTLTIGTYPDHQEPNHDNAVLDVVVDPTSQVKSGTIKVKGGPDFITYAFDGETPFHAPPVGAQHKWPTISHIEVCWSKPAPPKVGRAEITKVVVGKDAPSGTVFEIALTPEQGDPITKTINGAGVLTFEDLQPGLYTVSETDPGDNWEVTYSTTTIDVRANKTAKATVTNTYSEPAPELGTAEITKAVVGDDAPDAVFEITLTPEQGDPITKTINGAGVLTFDDLTPGTYTLSETDPGENWTVAYSTETITIVANQTATATVTNTYTRPVVPPELGSVVVTKVVIGDPPTTAYEIGLIGPAPAQTERWLTVVGAGEVVFEALPVGTYTVVERGPGDGYTVSISPTTVVVTNGGIARATVTNTYVDQQSAPPTTPPKVDSGSGAQPSVTTPTKAQTPLPRTGSDGQMAIIALAVLAGGAALVAVSRRRVTS